MNSRTSLLIATAAFAAVLATVRADDDNDQSEFPKITAQPTDQGIPLGSTTTFSVQATNGVLQFQWRRNGQDIDGETNSSITIQNAGVGDVGLYQCSVTSGTETVPTRAASLNVLAFDPGSDAIIVYGTPIVSGGSRGNSCPGKYAGYVNFTKTFSQGWGWTPSTNTTVYTATDGSGRTDTKVQYLGIYGDNGCAQTTVTLPYPAISPVYRFTIYFTNNVPTNAYPINLSGFDQ